MSITITKINKLPEFVRQKINGLLDKFRLLCRKPILAKQIKRLQNKDLTLISNNCNGCVLLHELGLRFNSQFVDLSIDADDYIKYLKNFDLYNGIELSFLEDETVRYPVGMIGDIRINFVHYKSFDHAKQKWDERKKRINKDNLFVIFTEQEDCMEACIKEFDKLEYENKVVFTCHEYSDVKSSIFVKKYFGNPKGVYMFLDFENKISPKRNYDVFDFVAWFNGEKDLSKLMGELK